MIDNIIQSVTEKLSSLPYIEGIVLGGSRARGTHTEDSDIDIGIYYKSESFDITAINQIATELDDENRNNLVVPPGAWGDWINGGGWLVINGYHVDLILRDIKRVEQIIKDTEQGIVTANYQTGHPHGYISAMYRGELAISKIQYAKNESLCELKNQAEIYPGALKKSLINFFLFEAEFSLMFVKANAGAEDKYYIAGHVFRMLKDQFSFPSGITGIYHKLNIRAVQQLFQNIELFFLIFGYCQFPFFWDERKILIQPSGEPFIIRIRWNIFCKMAKTPTDNAALSLQIPFFFF